MTQIEQITPNTVNFRLLSAHDQWWLKDALNVYIQAMQYSEITALRQEPVWKAHMLRPQIRIIGAFAGTKLIGITYGFPGNQTSRWCLELQNALTKRGQTSEEILSIITNYFELSELHVLPAYQGYGIGAKLLNILLQNQPHSHVLLSTPEVIDESNGAWRLYRKYGFRDVIRHHLFPGDFRSFAILGRHLPIVPSAEKS